MLLLQEVQKENKELKKKISNRQIKEEEEDYNDLTIIRSWCQNKEDKHLSYETTYTQKSEKTV